MSASLGEDEKEEGEKPPAELLIQLGLPLTTVTMRRPPASGCPDRLQSQIQFSATARGCQLLSLSVSL